MRHALLGHLKTIVGPFKTVPQRYPVNPWTTTFETERGPLEITGTLIDNGPSIFVLVHGLGGSTESGYIAAMQQAIAALGHSVLAFGLRGSKGDANDFYHAGLTDDVHAVIRALPETFIHIHVVGFSLGGHISIRVAAETEDPRVQAIAAICPPVDLRACQAHIDSLGATVYREYVLRELKAMYKSFHDRGVALPHPWSQARQIRSIRTWDKRIVVPRFGFGTAENYYDTQTAINVLDAIKVPLLVVASKHDPMIPYTSVAPHFADRLENVTFRSADGEGHVYFSKGPKLGFGAGSITEQVVGWATQ